MGRILRLGLVAILTLAFFAASAAGVPALTINTASITFPGVTLDGTSQTVTGSTSAWRADATGEEAAGTSRCHRPT